MRPCEPRSGPGAQDAFELVTRAVTRDRYTVDPALERPERGRTLERYVFHLGYRERTVTLLLREGLVREEFIDLSRKQGRTAQEEGRLTVLKQEMADRLLSAPAVEVYDVVPDTAGVRVGVKPGVTAPRW